MALDFLIAGKYRLGRKLGGGSFGEVGALLQTYARVQSVGPGRGVLEHHACFTPHIGAPHIGAPTRQLGTFMRLADFLGD